MLRVDANNPHNAFAFDDFAFVTNLFYTGPNFHREPRREWHLSEYIRRHIIIRRNVFGTTTRARSNNIPPERMLVQGQNPSSCKKIRFSCEFFRLLTNTIQSCAKKPVIATSFNRLFLQINFNLTLFESIGNATFC